MIDAYFDAAASRTASVSGVYQYDTGQRLRLRGLPSQSELSGIDNYIDTLYDEQGNVIPEEDRLPVVEVHFAYEGDSQAEMRLAVWDVDGQVWTVDVPDEYLTIAQPIHAYVTVFHGEVPTGNKFVDEETGKEYEETRTRTRTVYEAVFTPIHRSAPSNVATQEQWDQWAAKQEEIDNGLALIPAAVAGAQSAEAYAAQALEEIRKDAATQQAIDAAQAAQRALDAVRATGEAWETAKIEAVTLTPGAGATMTIGVRDGRKLLTLGIPKGTAGAKGDAGDTGPADITLNFNATQPYGLTITTV